MSRVLFLSCRVILPDVCVRSRYSTSMAVGIPVRLCRIIPELVWNEMFAKAKQAISKLQATCLATSRKVDRWEIFRQRVSIPANGAYHSALLQTQTKVMM